MLRSKKDRMWARVQKLATIYGPFVRFTPEGTEGTEGTEEGGKALDKAIESSEQAAKTPEEQAVIDTACKAEQQLEQEQSNTRRANEATKQAQTNLEEAQSDNTELQEKLEAAEARARAAGITDIDLNEEDYTGTDLALVRSIKSLKEQAAAKDERVNSLEKQATGYEEQAKANQAKAASNSAYQELLVDLDVRSTRARRILTPMRVSFRTTSSTTP